MTQLIGFVMAGQALVSILIPAYKSFWFETALRSAIQQDYPHCEIIIGDDSPNDDIFHIIEKLRSESPFLLSISVIARR
ncbi:glycosyltransferase [Apirhabdus apintestini]|nr:glycosyltransferase [Enterobacteriaceae bacterium CA-0114]